MRLEVSPAAVLEEPLILGAAMRVRVSQEATELHDPGEDDQEMQRVSGLSRHNWALHKRRVLEIARLLQVS